MVLPVSTAGWTRYVARRLFAALCVVACLLSWGSGVAAGQQGQAADPAGQLDDVRGKLDEARKGLGTVERQHAATFEDLRRIEAEQAALETQLQELTGQLASAEDVLAQAEADVTETSLSLDTTREQLVRTQARLDRHRDRFAARARESYKRGGMGLIEAALDLRHSAEFARSLKYVQVVMDADREQVAVVAGLQRQVAGTAQELSDLLVRQAAAERVAAGERDHVAQLVASSQELLASVEAKATERMLVLRQLEQDKVSYQRLVSSLEDESARLEEELRRRAAEEEARRVAAAEAARRVAVANEARRGDSPAADRGGGAAARGNARFHRPSDGRVTSNFGYRTHPIFGTRRLHAGMDFGAPRGAPIYAAEAGVVVSAGRRGGYGIATVIDHGGGLTTLYGHQSSVEVRAGEQVSRGEVIGRVGSTGFSTGPHLHFEVRVSGSPVDPRGYL